MNRKLKVRFGSRAAVFAYFSLTTAFGGKADVQTGQFCENLGDIPECPLFPKAVVQIPQKLLKLRSAFGQKRTFDTKPSNSDNCCLRDFARAALGLSRFVSGLAEFPMHIARNSLGFDLRSP